MTFTAADHVTEQEPGGWEDCTFAALLETIRLGLSHGKAIPATIVEVNRFRAATGLPDGHHGVTIEGALPAARRLYGMTVGDYRLSRDWAEVEEAIRQPGTVFTLTGLMSAVPPVMRRWDSSFTGAHAVAGRGGQSPTWCDPLAPKGTYKGEPVTMATWKAFATSMVGWQAFIMETRGEGDGMIAAGGISIKSDKVARITTATPVLDSPGGTQVTTLRVGQKVPYVGNSSGHRAVVIVTGIPYPDKVARPSILYVVNAAVVIEDAPIAPGGDTGPAVQAKWEQWITTRPK